MKKRRMRRASRKISGGDAGTLGFSTEFERALDNQTATPRGEWLIVRCKTVGAGLVPARGYDTLDVE